LWPTGALAESYEVFATTPDTYGNQIPNPYLPTEVDEYDYGSNTPGALLRKTLTT